MLMDYINEPQARRAPPEGVQVAGLLYDIPQNAYDDFKAYRRSMMPPPLGSAK